MLKKTPLAGILFAGLAAFVNGSVGVLSVFLFSRDLSSSDVAFLKCILACFVAISIVLLSGKSAALKNYLRQKWLLSAVCAFFGFFVLYHFETAAYLTVPVAVVAFCFIGSATLVTFMISALLQRRWLSFRETVSIILALIGMYCLFLANTEEVHNIAGRPIAGLIKACLAGGGYGLFMVLAKYYRLGSGMVVIASLTIFASIFLSVPVILNAELTIPSEPKVWLGLLSLAVLPTIGGFWFTTKALTLLSSQSVQLIELLEPVFALLFGLIFLAQLPAGMQLFGGAMVLAAILVHELWPKLSHTGK
ncbi:DMT family transporter [Cardiobacteriaceae bacterium TAE3-ERU3]|nr:DMT family transporter [Cardiobacteriaceae bacterium TAE3-ERU3]